MRGCIHALKASREMKITVSLFEAGLKCLTKCFLLSLDEQGTGNAYADWVRIKTDSYRREGIKGLMARAAHDECISVRSGRVIIAKYFSGTPECSTNSRLV